MAQRPAHPGGGGPGALRPAPSARGGASDPFAMLSFAGGGDVGGGDDDDADLDDPELLAELAALSGGAVDAAPSTTRSAAAGRGAAAAGAVRATHALSDDDDDEHGGGADADHEYHAELAALTGGGGGGATAAGLDDDADVDLLDFGDHQPSSLQGGSASAYGGGGGAPARAPVPAAAAKAATAAAAASRPAPAPAPAPAAAPKPAAPALPPATAAAIERYRTLAEGVRQKALVARAAGAGGAGKGGSRGAATAASAASPDTPAALLPAAHWLAEYKGLQDELAQLAAGVPVATVEAATAARRARAARDRGYNELRHALYTHYRARIGEGTSLAAALRTPGLPREERADIKRRYEAAVADKRAMEAALNRLDGCYKHPTSPPPPAWAWAVTSETRCESIGRAAF
jgi:hypothetical protein